MSRLRPLAVLAMLVWAAGCSSIRQHGAEVDPAAVRARLGQAPCAVASLLIKIEPKEGEGELFTLRLWVAGDGRVRVLAHKLDVDFLSALVEADGSYVALLPREKVWTRGHLGSPDDPLLLRDLAVMVAEVCQGPIPPGAATAADGHWRIRDAAGWTADLAFDPVSGKPSGKRLLAADGSEGRRLAYARWQVFDGLDRPTAVVLNVVGDTATYAIRLKSLDAPPGISAERMALHIPEGASEIAVAEFAKRVGE